MATATANDTVVSHTVDTYSGQSGAPICLRAPDRLELVGVHTRPGTAANQGVRVTDRMLTELSGWMNADAGAEVATVVDHVLQVAAKAPAAKVPDCGSPGHFILAVQLRQVRFRTRSRAAPQHGRSIRR